VNGRDGHFIDGTIAPTTRPALRGASVAGPIPSLYTAFAPLRAEFFLPPGPGPLLACYPPTMMVSLVYSGEHWVTDTLFGIGYAGANLAAVTAAEHLWRRHRPGHIPSGVDRHRRADTGPASVAAFGHEHATPHTRQGG